MRSTHRVLAAMAAIVMLLAACGRDDGGPVEPGEIRTDIGVEGKTIRLGHLTPLTEAVAVIGKPLTKGHEVYFQYVNEELGGVGQDLDEADRFQVVLEIEDTQYVPNTHVQKYAALKDRVLAIAQSLGTPTTQAILPQIREDQILTGAATLSSEWLSEKYLVTAGAPYPVQFINAADYLVNELDTEIKAGILYQDDDYGQEGVKGVEYAAEELDFEIVGRAAFGATDTEFTAQITQLRDSGADHVFLTATPTSTGAIIGTAARAGFTPRWIGQSPTWIGAFATHEQLSPILQQSFWLVTDASCEWGETGTGCSGMKEMLANVEKYAADQVPDIYFQFGYTQAKIFHAILEEAVSRGDLTRAGIVEAFENLSEVDMGGLLNPISFGAECEDRIPSTGSSILKVDPAKPAGLSEVATVDSDVVKEFPFCD